MKPVWLIKICLNKTYSKFIYVNICLMHFQLVSLFFIFRSSWVQISAQTTTNLTEVACYGGNSVKQKEILSTAVWALQQWNLLTLAAILHTGGNIKRGGWYSLSAHHNIRREAACLGQQHQSLA
jgi:hypothetical protein